MKISASESSVPVKNAGWPLRALRKCFHGGESTLQLLLSCVIVMGLVSMLLIGVNKAMQSAKTTQCLSNLRQIQQATLLYRQEYNAFPLPSENQTLRDLLRPLLGDNPKVFHCPEDGSSLADSYSYFYAARSESTAADNYFLGCSRHRHSTRGVGLFTGDLSGDYTALSSTAAITHDDAPTRPGVEFDYGTFRFADGSQASISMGQNGNNGNGNGNNANGNSPDHPVLSVLFSTRRSDGTHYTVVKMKEGQHGTVTFSVVPGNRFEVVTPAAIIAVRGTQFSVTTLNQGNKPATRVTVSSGSVDMEPVSKRGKKLNLTPGPGQNTGFAVQGEDPQLQ